MSLTDYLVDSWRAALADEFDKAYWRQLQQFLEQRYQTACVFPDSRQVFAALNAAPLNEVRVVILGQDPYHGPGQAHGLSFSVPDGCGLPPSLRNIFRELATDFGWDAMPRSGSLLGWARQGVLLLNTVLTVEQGQAAAHQGRGWEQLTDRIIELVSESAAPSVFMLWGAPAQKKARRIDDSRHCVLRAPHPSPLSAHRGFLGCRHFSACNLWLQSHGRQPIDWRAVGQ